MAFSNDWKFAVWERLNKKGKWCPFSSEVSNLLENCLRKKLETVPLGDADENLKIYSVSLKELCQTSSVTGTKSKIRRQIYDCVNSLCNGFTWQWSDGQDSWQMYDVEINDFLENSFQKGLKTVSLNKAFHGHHYEIDFTKMSQMNKRTKRKRPIRRQQNISPYPVVRADDVIPSAPPLIVPVPDQQNLTQGTYFSNLSKEVPGTAALFGQVNDYMRNVQQSFVPDSNVQSGSVSATNDNQSGNVASISQTSPGALVNGKPYYDHRPPHTPTSMLKPVPGIDPIPCDTTPKKSKKKKAKRGTKTDAVPGSLGSVLDSFTNLVPPETLTDPEEQVCSICLASLVSESSYEGDSAVLQLKICSHMFHKSCLSAMYACGPKNSCLQCPVCKQIHGEKCGIQPPGSMIYHVLPYSLPGHHDCDTIRIIYDFASGTQGPEHPNPGKKYTAFAFPRHCYIPDNEMGRKVLRLLVKAWKRRLIFTVGRSSTSGADNVITWNEIHHKTEFGFNRRGHGYPDPNYFENVLAELEAQGVKDDEVYEWYPA